jgi:hypothetical protein
VDKSLEAALKSPQQSMWSPAFQWLVFVILEEVAEKRSLPSSSPRETKDPFSREVYHLLSIYFLSSEQFFTKAV